MNDQQLDRAFGVLEQHRETGAFPGYVAGVAHKGQVVTIRSGGLAQLDPIRPMTSETLFDMASVTKVMATTPAVLALVDDGLLSLDEPLWSLMPEFAVADKRAITVRLLLTHSAGLPSWRPTYAFSKSPEESIRYIASLPLAYEPGTDVQYTCLGFILLGELVRRVSGSPLDQFVAERIYRPMALRQTGFGPVSPDQVAATEEGNRYEAAMAVRGGVQVSCTWRTGITAGTVNDGNAYYTMGGISGNAGLFSTAADTLRFGQMWLDRGRLGGVRILSEAVVAEATRDQTPGLPFGRGLGWIVQRSGPPGRREFLPSPSSREFLPPEAYEAFTPPRSGGDYLSPGSYGHTGFTGTSLWIDPARELVMVLLTNRTHPVVRPEIAWTRPRFHNAIVAAFSE